MNIRKIKHSEIDKLIDLATITFKETFAESNNADDIEQYISKNFNKSALRAEMNTKDSFFYFGEIENKPVGYLKLNRGSAQKEKFHPGWLELERIYILAKYQRKGLGSFLVDFAFRQAEYYNSEYLWLGVWENNHSAIRFYREIGFEEFSKHTFKVGSDPQRDLLMKMATKRYLAITD